MRRKQEYLFNISADSCPVFHRRVTRCRIGHATSRVAAAGPQRTKIRGRVEREHGHRSGAAPALRPRTGAIRSRAFSTDLVPRHRIADGSADRLDAITESRAVLERDLDGRHAHRQQARERLVGHVLRPWPAGGAPPDRSSAPCHARAANDAVPSTSITAIMCCRQISGMSRLSTTAPTVGASRTTTFCTSSAVERTLAAQVRHRVERRLDRRADRPLLDVGARHLVALPEPIDQRRRRCPSAHSPGSSCPPPRTHRPRR